jgi:hypothetical protein
MPINLLKSARGALKKTEECWVDRAPVILLSLKFLIKMLYFRVWNAHWSPKSQMHRHAERLKCEAT